jgi:hypothetical protein
MKFKNVIMINSYDLEAALEEEFDETYEILTLFFEESFTNDSAMELFLAPEQVWSEYDDAVAIERRNKVRKFLQEMWPDEESVWISIAW